ncbi:DUF4292 domain-containing protein [Phaeocystidibacter luteus]|uniref:DUF4292 domain-containing protein n=1 Tax=Phaeocystidibacter luteus TaxID=911197 RepID=A0A6N6RL74_9FLAO|nr:DUF4292 domain-containing protein [Phaeocystidibacter luteus]KAB2813871.1 DUF4292 domain-containing protein [Phaeocystidibacter luteus]
MRYSKHISVIALLFLVAACGPKELLFDVSTDSVEEKDFFSAMRTSLDSANVVEFVGSANYDSPDQEVSFGYTIRIARDSVIWMDITDPYVGLKLARAVIYPDSAVMYNRFEKSWMAGGAEVVKEAFGVSLNFYHLQAVLLGEPMFIPEKSDDISLSVEPGIVLVDAIGDPADSLFQYTSPVYQYKYGYVRGLPLTRQSINDSLRSVDINYTYLETDTGIPYDVMLMLNWDGKISIQFNHRDVLRDVDLYIPFSVPDGYERIR